MKKTKTKSNKQRFLGFTQHNRDLKIRRRRRQRERHKTIGLISKYNSSARALYVFVHFFAVLCKTTTWNDQIQGFVENVSTRRRIFHSPS